MYLEIFLNFCNLQINFFLEVRKPYVTMFCLLQGRTVTIKLKNVNFEVKTRASTVSSVVSTAEEIFAIAKDLLRTEIDGPLVGHVRTNHISKDLFLKSMLLGQHEVS